jgi:lysophospholipase L1-like esterase
MKASLRLLLAAAVLGGGLVGTAGDAGAADRQPTYYVSLGDSLAAGYQPVGSFNRGYANQLYRATREEIPGLRLNKLGCPGETTDSMITGEGSLCTYPSGSQLNEAVTFLQAHRGQIWFVTIDIGVNDALEACFDDAGVWHRACVDAALPHIESNLASIIEALKGAAPGVPVAGMGYYDPFLGFWVQGERGQKLARIDEQTLETLNAGLIYTYRNEGVLAADVASPEFFDTANFTDLVRTEMWGVIPVNVAKACRDTWMCTPCPTCPDVHANTAGNGVIAEALKEVLGL